MDSGVLKCWFSIGCIKDNVFCSGCWCVKMLVFFWSGVLKCWFLLVIWRNMFSVMDSGVLRCWISVGFIKEHALCRGFWCVSMLMFYWLYKGKYIMGVDSGVLNNWCSIVFIKEKDYVVDSCVRMLIFYWFYKGKCIRSWVLVCKNVDFPLVVYRNM